MGTQVGTLVGHVGDAHVGDAHGGGAHEGGALVGGGLVGEGQVECTLGDRYQGCRVAPLGSKGCWAQGVGNLEGLVGRLASAVVVVFLGGRKGIQVSKARHSLEKQCQELVYPCTQSVPPGLRPPHR